MRLIIIIFSLLKHRFITFNIHCENIQYTGIA